MSKKNETVLIEDLLVDLTRPTTAEDEIAPIKTPEELQDDPVYSSLYSSLKKNEPSDEKKN